jgi:hypothetical protein
MKSEKIFFPFKNKDDALFLVGIVVQCALAIAVWFCRDRIGMVILFLGTSLTFVGFLVGFISPEKVKRRNFILTFINILLIVWTYDLVKYAYYNW